MQSLSAPVRRRKKRHDDAFPYRRTAAMVLVVERMRADVAAEVRATSRHLFFRQRLRAAGELAGDGAARAAFAGTVLNGLHLHVVLVLGERAQDAAVVR